MTDDLGRLDRTGDRWQLTFDRRLPQPPETVFAALTEPDHLAAWFPTSIDGDRAAGAKLRFDFRDGADGPPIEGEMLAWDPPRLVEFSWGEDTLRFELAPDGAGTRLTLVNTFVEQGKGARDGAGWHTCLDLLAADLSGTPPFDSTTRWREVHPRYVDALGPEAATIGPPPGHG
jgi:uncharacterized protein YndB with AHSA1/START domain